MGKKLPTINVGLYHISIAQLETNSQYAHIERVALDREGKAAFYLRVLRSGIRVFQRAARQYSLLLIVECNSTKFLPV